MEKFQKIQKIQDFFVDIVLLLPISTSLHVTTLTPKLKFCILILAGLVMNITKSQPRTSRDVSPKRKHGPSTRWPIPSAKYPYSIREYTGHPVFSRNVILARLISTFDHSYYQLTLVRFTVVEGEMLYDYITRGAGFSRVSVKNMRKLVIHKFGVADGIKYWYGLRNLRSFNVAKYFADGITSDEMWDFTTKGNIYDYKLLKLLLWLKKNRI